MVTTPRLIPRSSTLNAFTGQNSGLGSVSIGSDLAEFRDALAKLDVEERLIQVRSSNWGAEGPMLEYLFEWRRQLIFGHFHTAHITHDLAISL